MKKIMGQVVPGLLLVLLPVILGGCASTRMLVTGTPAQQNTRQEGSPQPVLSGVVVETMDAGGYTYICLEADGARSWIAIPAARVMIGEEIQVLPGTEMGNFTSRSLNRTFDSIVFSPGISTIIQAGPKSGKPAAEVRNLRVGQEGDNAVATYDLVSRGGDGVVEVAVAIIINGQRRNADQLSLSGDFGKNVTIGPGKRIVWNARADLPADFDGEVSWDVAVTKKVNRAGSNMCNQCHLL